MIVLDTNVLSEVLRPVPEPSVMDWPDAADMYSEIVASRRGKPISQFDAMIVAMTRSRGAGLATRNVKDFEDCGVELLNPWAA